MNNPNSNLSLDSPSFEAIRCIRCEYDLRGLDADKVCPECGLRVIISKARHTLGVFDPSWIARLDAGSFWLTKALGIVGLTACIVTPVLGIALQWFDVIAFILPISIVVPVAVGVWHYTQPSMIQLTSSHGELARKLAQRLMLFSMVVVIPGLTVAQIGGLVNPELIKIGLVAGSVVLSVGIAAFGFYCLTLAKLIQEVRAERTAKSTLVQFCVGTVIGIAAFFIPAGIMPSAGPRSVIMALAAVIVIRAGAFLCGIPTLLCDRIKGIRAEAAGVWAKYDLAEPVK